MARLSIWFREKLGQRLTVHGPRLTESNFMHYFLLVLVDAANYLIQVGIKEEAVPKGDSLFFLLVFSNGFCS